MVGGGLGGVSALGGGCVEQLREVRSGCGREGVEDRDVV
jgi:hypothetical protein